MKQNSLFSGKELFLNSGMIFSAGFLGALFLFASNLFLSRHFGPEIFGNYKTIVSLFVFLPLLVDFGAGPTLTKYIAEFLARKEDGKINKLVRFFFKVKGLSLFTLVVIIYVFRADFSIAFLKDPALSYLVVPGLVLSFFILFEITKPVILGFQNFKLFSFSNFLTTASIGIGTVALGYYYGVYYAILGWSLGYFVGNLPNLWFILKKRFLSRSGAKLDVSQIVRKYSFPMYGMGLLNMSSVLIIPVLSLFFPQKLIGYFGFAWIFYSGIMLIPAAFAQVLFPKVSEFEAKKLDAKTYIASVFGAYTFIAVIGVLAMYFFSSHIISFVSIDYLPGLLIFKWLTVAGFVLGYLLIYANYLNAKQEIKKAACISFLMNATLFFGSFLVMM